MPFSIDSDPSQSEISDALNYLLANIGAGIPPDAYAVSNNPTTGFVSNTLGDILQYQYRYLDIKYADNASGLNFSDNPYSRLYFGLRNTEEVTESLNPADYIWFSVAGGFGINKVLWIAVTGGRHVAYAVSQDAPDGNQNWQVAPIQSVDLDNPFKTYEQYMTVRFATNSVGAGFSTSPTSAKFYGIYTSADGSSAADPTEYAWSPFDFGSTYNLYYRSLGGRNIAFTQSTFQPLGYIPYSDLVINLDVTTSASVISIGIISQSPLIVQAPYRYLLVRYADNQDGDAISTDPTGKQYFGLQASDVIAIDDNPADYTWFAAGGILLTDVNIWVRSTVDNVVQFSLTLEAPDSTGWYNITADNTVATPHIDVYARTGLVVTNITSPTDGRLGASSLGTSGLINLNLDPFGQGKNTGGFEINPAAVSTIQFDQFGRVIQANALDQVRYGATLTTATSGQTVFSVTNAQPDQLLVFRNGSYFDPGSDYTRTSTTVTLANACTAGDQIAIYYIRLIDGGTSADKVPFVTETQTLTSGQTMIDSTFPDGSELLFLNGVLLVDADYSYVGSNQGYILNNPAQGGTLVIVSFAFNNGNVLIFGENYTETLYGTTNVSFPTPFYRDSSLIWFNGVLLKPTSDYTIPGSGATSYNLTSIGWASFAGQPVQFCSFNSAGPAVVGGVGSAGVHGLDQPVVIERAPTMLEMFNKMQKQISKLQKEVRLLKGKE